MEHRGVNDADLDDVFDVPIIGTLSEQIYNFRIVSHWLSNKPCEESLSLIVATFAGGAAGW